MAKQQLGHIGDVTNHIPKRHLAGSLTTIPSNSTTTASYRTKTHHNIHRHNIHYTSNIHPSPPNSLQRLIPQRQSNDLNTYHWYHSLSFFFHYSPNHAYTNLFFSLWSFHPAHSPHVYTPCTHSLSFSHCAHPSHIYILFTHTQLLSISTNPSIFHTHPSSMHTHSTHSLHAHAYSLSILYPFPFHCNYLTHPPSLLILWAPSFHLFTLPFVPSPILSPFQLEKIHIFSSQRPKVRVLHIYPHFIPAHPPIFIVHFLFFINDSCHPQSSTVPQEMVILKHIKHINMLTSIKTLYPPKHKQTKIYKLPNPGGEVLWTCSHVSQLSDHGLMPLHLTTQTHTLSNKLFNLNTSRKFCLIVTTQTQKMTILTLFNFHTSHKFMSTIQSSPVPNIMRTAKNNGYSTATKQYIQRSYQRST